MFIGVSTGQDEDDEIVAVLKTMSYNPSIPTIIPALA